MHDSTMPAHDLKQHILAFSDTLSRGLSRPTRKFVRDMLFGILASGSVQLASIARALKESVDLKKSCERLARNLTDLSNREHLQLMAFLAASLRKQVDPSTPILLDHTDIIKPGARKMEGLGYVWDGSRGVADSKGYAICEAVVHSVASDTPTPVYTDLYSYREKRFLSVNRSLYDAVEFLHACYGTQGIYTMDRGMDDAKLFRFLHDRRLAFSIRLVGTRHVINAKGETLSARDLAARYKGNRTYEFTSRNGKLRRIDYSAIPITIPALPDIPFLLLVVRNYSYKPLLLLANPASAKDPRSPLDFILAYIARWKIEEVFRYRKVSARLEAIQVRSLKRIRTLNLFAMLAAAFAATLARADAHRALRDVLFGFSKRERERKARFLLYALAHAIRRLLGALKDGIRYLMPIAIRKRRFQQLEFPQVRLMSAFQFS